MSGIPAKKAEWRACAEAVISASMISEKLGAKAIVDYTSRLGGEWDLAINNVRTLRDEIVKNMGKDLTKNPAICMTAVEASIQVARAEIYLK